MTTVKFIPDDGSKEFTYEIETVPGEGHTVLLDGKEFRVRKIVHDVGNRVVNVHLGKKKLNG